MELDPQLSPEDIMSREVELLKKVFLKVGLPLLELSKLFVNSSATDIVFVTVQARQLKQ